MCAAMASTGTRLRWQSNRPLIRCRLPGPQLPAQTASRPVSAASAPAAKAADSSCRTCIHSMRPSRRRLSFRPLRLSPVTPQMRSTPRSARLWARRSATVKGMAAPESRVNANGRAFILRIWPGRWRRNGATGGLDVRRVRARRLDPWRRGASAPMTLAAGASRVQDQPTRPCAASVMAAFSAAAASSTTSKRSRTRLSWVTSRRSAPACASSRRTVPSRA